MGMTKSDLKNIFGGTIQSVADAIGITKQGISQWPENLRQDQQDRSIGAAIRLNITIPAHVIDKFIREK